MADDRFTAFAVAFLTTIGISNASAEIRIGVAAPLTGGMAWGGERTRAGAYMALEDVNERGGVLGEPLAAVLVDDFCDPGQAVAAAQKLVAEGVPFVVGHQCSGAAIRASSIYEQAGIIFISPAATNPQLTERGLRHTFRTCGRDDVQGTMIGDYIAKTWPGADIAIVHDGQAYGQGVAEEAGRRLDALGIETELLEQVQPGQNEFFDLVGAFEAHGIDVAFYGGYPAEAGLIVRQAKARLPELDFVVPDGVGSEDFWLIAGAAAEGTPMTSYMDATGQPAAADAVARFRAAGTDPTGTELYAYAAVQAWAQAVEQAGTTDAARIAEVLRQERFDTVLGTIGFDGKGDVTGFDPFVWYVWTEGKFVPKDLTD
ncbi:MAG: branched-chain amino acid ABC transporter substrate-binding protein [Geminicoccaceae bacterium]